MESFSIYSNLPLLQNILLICYDFVHLSLPNIHFSARTLEPSLFLPSEMTFTFSFKIRILFLCDDISNFCNGLFLCCELYCHLIMQMNLNLSYNRQNALFIMEVINVLSCDFWVFEWYPVFVQSSFLFVCEFTNLVARSLY